MFLEAYPGYEVPDMSAVRVHVFDKDWKRLTKQTFPTGYRFFLAEVRIVNHKSLKQDLLVAKATSAGPFIVSGNKKKPAFEQGNFQRQHYALLSKWLVMVRLEDDKGKLARNHYRWSTPPKGPPVPKRTKDQWIRSLSSDDPVQQLATLVWLTGIHCSSTEPRYENVNQESVEDSKLFETVRDDSQSSKAFQMLTNSKYKWIQEYAKLGATRSER